MIARALAAPAAVLRVVRRRPYLVLAVGLVFLAGIGLLAPANAVAAEDGPTPQGFGDMLGDLGLRGAQKATLFEAYPMTAYYFDMNRLGANDAIHITLNSLASLFMFLTAAIVRGAITLLTIMFDYSEADALAATVTGNIGTTATELMAWLLPTALAIGGLTAYAQNRGTRGGGFSQLLWVFAGGLLAVSFATSPSLWVDTLSDVRTVASQSVMAASANSVTVAEQPFDYTPAATYDEGDPQNTMLRKSADAIWRAYVVTPWCLAEFGSQENCTRYGQGLLEQGVNPDTRSDWIESTEANHPGEYNSDGDGYRWIAGKNSHERLGMAIIAFLVALLFASLIIAISFMSLLAFVSAIMLLFVGVLFVMMWCIPGRPRAWGNKWFETVIGLMIQSVIGTLIISATLVLTSAAFSLAGTNGWGAAAGLSIMVCIAAFSMRRTVGAILGALTPGMGMTGMLGAMAMRGGAKLAGRMTGRVASAAWNARKAPGRFAKDTGNAVRQGWRDAAPSPAQPAKASNYRYRTVRPASSRPMATTGGSATSADGASSTSTPERPGVGGGRPRAGASAPGARPTAGTGPSNLRANPPLPHRPEPVAVVDAGSRSPRQTPRTRSGALTGRREYPQAGSMTRPASSSPTPPPPAQPARETGARASRTPSPRPSPRTQAPRAERGPRPGPPPRTPRPGPERGTR